LENNQNVGVDACWRTNFPPGNILGGAFTTDWIDLTNQNNETTAFPSALAEHLVGGQYNSIDISADFNANLSNWYFGLDANPPASDYDFVTVVLHELGHGLGFISIRKINDGVSPNGCDGFIGEGCIGLRVGFRNYIPTMFDRHVDKLSNGAPITSLPNPGTEIYSLLQGTGGGLSWDETNPCYFYGGVTNSPMNLPNPYQGGSSYTHYDNSALPNELMGPSLTTGKGLHDVGLAANVMYNIGWSTPFPKLTVTDLSDSGTGSFRSVIERSCTNNNITFQTGLTGDITLTKGQIMINHPLKITGPGSSMLSVSGDNSSRIFNISNSGDLELIGLTLKNAVESINGGAIFNNGGTLTLENVVLENNKQGVSQKALTATSSSNVTVKNSVTIKN
jgi:hypothetical protein